MSSGRLMAVNDKMVSWTVGLIRTAKTAPTAWAAPSHWPRTSMNDITAIPVRPLTRHQLHPSSRASTGMSVRAKGPETPPPAPQLHPIFPSKVLEASPQATYHCCGAPNLLPTSFSSFLFSISSFLIITLPQTTTFYSHSLYLSLTLTINLSITNTHTHTLIKK